MKTTKALACAKRKREEMEFEVGEEVSNALTINIEHHLTLLYMEQEKHCDKGVSRTFHRQVRVVYRACRKKYGIEKAQDECLELFKMVFPEYHKAKSTEEATVTFSDVAQNRIRALFERWNPESELKAVCDYVLVRMTESMSKDDFLQFCDDILPVIMRIRKLTPRECGRLQGCDEHTIDVIEASGVSKSAQYKLYGNSITVDVLFHIFRKLFVEIGYDVNNVRQPMQLSFF